MKGTKRLSVVSAEKVAKKFVYTFFRKYSNKPLPIDIIIKGKKIDAIIKTLNYISFKY